MNKSPIITVYKLSYHNSPDYEICICPSNYVNIDWITIYMTIDEKCTMKIKRSTFRQLLKIKNRHHGQITNGGVIYFENTNMLFDDLIEEIKDANSNVIVRKFRYLWRKIKNY